MPLRYIDQAEDEYWAGLSVVARFDFNVPLKQGGEIADTTRLDTALPTIRYLLERGVSRLVMMSHLGRPAGQVVEQLSLRPVGSYLADQLGVEVVLTEDCTNAGITRLMSLSKTKVVLLENLRFHPEEVQNDWGFAKALASYGKAYVNDAFGCCHRQHASVYGINAFFKKNSWGGLLLRAELEALAKVVGRPEVPFVAVMGGAKVSDKIAVLQVLLSKVERVLLGGAMAYPLLKAKGYEVGRSLCSAEDFKLAQTLLDSDKHEKIVLPRDHLASEQLGGDPVSISGPNLRKHLMGLDIGPQTLEHYREQLVRAKTIFWNGPMGLFENAHYSQGTMGMARLLAEMKGCTVVGGGDSVRAVKQSGMAGQMDHISTGGGAALEFIEHSGTLPGLQVLRFGLKR